MAIGMLHTLTGLASQWSRITTALAEGGVGTWASSAETAAAYWFLVAGRPSSSWEEPSPRSSAMSQRCRGESSRDWRP